MKAKLLIDNYRNPASNVIFSECPVPKKVDCFQQIPVLNVSCGENHSIAVFSLIMLLHCECSLDDAFR